MSETTNPTNLCQPGAPAVVNGGAPAVVNGGAPAVVNVIQSARVSTEANELMRPSRSDFAIEARGICKAYRIGGESRQVLNHINFSASIGECVFLSGPSGSGKSTLLSILGCLLEPDEGRIAIGGRRVDRLSVSERTFVRRSRIGFVFQRFQLIKGISAQDNVAVPLTLQGVSLSKARELAGQLLEHVGLGLHRHALPKRMSPGQCQRVALARAVIARPKLVLADEPTAALDGKSGAEVMELLKQLVRSAGASAVVVTHDPRIHHYADRVCEIENGVLR